MATKSDKIWADAVRKAVHEYGESKDANGKAKKIRHLNQLARQLVKSGLNGDMQALKEIGDRLDGRPNQSSDVNLNVKSDIASFLESIGRGDGEAAAVADGSEDEPKSVH